MTLHLRTADPIFRRFLDATAAYCGLPPFSSSRRVVSFDPGVWLEGWIITESAGEPLARRYEPAQDRENRTMPRQVGDLPNSDNGDLEDAASYGLLQIMGYNIRSLCGVAAGVPMNFHFALLPMTNVSLGLRVLFGELHAVSNESPATTLAYQKLQITEVERALARYNGGPTGERLGPYPGGMRLMSYVDKVVENSRLVLEDRLSRGYPR